MSAKPVNGSGRKARRWGPRMVLIVVAMLAVALAFFVGLHVQAALPLVPSLIGSIAVFLALLTTLPKGRPQPPLPDDLQARLALFENEIVTLADRLEQLQDISGKIGRIDELTPTLTKLEGLLKEVEHHGPKLGQEERHDANFGLGELSEKLKQLDSRLTELDSHITGENLKQQTELQARINDLDRIVHELAVTPPPAAAGEEPGALPAPAEVQVQAQAQTQTKSPAAHQPPAAARAPVKAAAPATARSEPAVTAKPRDESPPARVSSPVSERIHASLNLPGMGELSRDEQRMLAIITNAIENRRIEIYLQPVVELPKRKTVYYEVYTRLRGEGHTLILPDMFVPVAERTGLMPLIDNMMLLRAVKIIRQMDERTRAKGLFCSLSTQSLVDPDFFPKLVSYLEKNRDLAGRIIFEISQTQKKSAGHIEREGMRRLALLGFKFSLDKVIDLDIDYDELARRDFKYVRISAERLLHGMAELGARIHGADKASYLERFGIELIVEKIETERELATLADYNIKLGQGFLFAEPRPVRPEVLGERAA